MKLLKIVRNNYIYKKISTIKRKIKYRERKTSYGDKNPDDVFYIIGQHDKTCGLWWIINKVIMHIAYAEEKGYIPVVDYLTFQTQYHMPSEIGKVNVWEKFFEQPSGICLKDISESKNIILSDQYSAPNKKYLMGNTDFYTDLDRREYFRRIFDKYIRFTTETENLLEERRRKIIPNNKKVLGILCRGTDYLLKRPKDHPIQPQPQTVISMAKEALNKYECDYIFLATEDADILALFKKSFPNKLLFIDQKRVSHEEMKNVERVMAVNVKINDNRYEMGLNYLTATYILSKCDCFIGGRTGGTKGVLLMTKGFEYEYVFNLGFYS